MHKVLKITVIVYRELRSDDLGESNVCALTTFFHGESLDRKIVAKCLVRKSH